LKKIKCQSCNKLIDRWPNNRKYCDECKADAYKEKKSIYCKKYKIENRERINLYRREYYAENPEKHKEYCDKYKNKNPEAYSAKRRKNYENDPDKYRGYAIVYYNNNTEKCIANSRNWEKENPERKKELNRKSYWKNRQHALEYREKNKEKIAKRRKIWVKKNLIHVRTKVEERRAMKMNADGSYTAEEFIKLCNYYNWTCLYCGKKLDEITVTADHVTPLSKGGSNYIENIVPACLHCNVSKNNKSILSFMINGGFKPCAQAA